MSVNDLPLTSFSLISMDPVQTDLQRLGVKPPDPADYNIHTPPFPGPGEHCIGIIDCKENREKENINYNLLCELFFCTDHNLQEL